MTLQILEYSLQTLLPIPTIKFNLKLNDSSVLGSAKSLELTIANSKKPQASVPNMRLNNGNQIPVMGLGTYKYKQGEVAQNVMDAIDSGYRFIDSDIRNAKDVGAAIHTKFAEGAVQRKDLFVSAKLWCQVRSRSLVIPTLQKTLKDLGLDYIDLYLLDWPQGQNEQNLDAFLDAWKGMEDAYKSGLARAIGLSNFGLEPLQRLLEIASVTPAVNQLEVSPHSVNFKVVNLCQSEGICIIGKSPWNGISSSQGKPKAFAEPVIKQLARKYGKTRAQIVLRWSVQRNIIALPKSNNVERLQAYINVFDFTLSKAEMENINNLNEAGQQ